MAEVWLIAGKRARKSPFTLAVLNVQADQLVILCDGKNPVAEAEHVGRDAAAGQIFPTAFAGLSFKSIEVADTALQASAIGADNDQFFGDEHIPVKAGLASVSDDVVGPLHAAGVFVERVENAGAGSDVEQIFRDRGRGEHSATGVKPPKHVQMIQELRLVILWQTLR